MNLLQKLPIGLGLACLMFMSSCSKEDAAVSPALKQEQENIHSSHKGVTYVLPFFAPTIGAVGKEVYPAGWQAYSFGPGQADPLIPAGTSSLTHLWGGNAFPWEKPLPPVPTAPNANSVVTVSNHGSVNDISYAGTKIKNLTPGRKYAITFYLATTKLKGAYTTPQEYATNIYINLNAKFVQVNLKGKEATWIPQTITFDAVSNEEVFDFFAGGEIGSYAYAHVFVDKNSIKDVTFNH
ncbi:hypothetical protein [Dyadobacter psychrophilus]|uniref:DUF642 domain-containing protein n=1 Tax=Dyadobacter psychrophilus TaxID=651661 RepID=A0A1T5H2Z1_9BACT|nr:hypothetical protein [Dyadobacter psychrophilus]SKC15063.1 hypothetical protein SAMN05660293_04782 [Dyadobacter psychrophilus]